MIRRRHNSRFSKSPICDFATVIHLLRPSFYQSPIVLLHILFTGQLGLLGLLSSLAVQERKWQEAQNVRICLYVNVHSFLLVLCEAFRPNNTNAPRNGP